MKSTTKKKTEYQRPIREYVCQHCGKTFKAQRERKYCCKSCAKHHQESLVYQQVKTIDYKKARTAMQERLRQRDLAYEKAFPNYHHKVIEKMNLKPDNFGDLMRRYY